MKTAPAPPFLTAPLTAVVAGDWCFALDGEALRASIDHWDPNMDVSVTREFSVDLNAVRDAAGLGDGAALALVPSWHGSKSRLSGFGPAIELGTARELATFAARIDVPGRHLAGELTLRSALLLRNPGSGGKPLAPRRAGAVLWSDEQRTLVEGTAARFPITAVSFGRLPGLPSKAGWFVELDYEELDAPLLGALRLLINADRDDIMSAVSAGDSPSATALQTFIHFDVARALISAALSDEEFVARADGWPEESIGRMLQELIASVWPGQSVRALVARRGEDAGLIDADIQAHFMEMFG